MKQPHKHAELIKAWADGAVIQIKLQNGNWEECATWGVSWDPDYEYRIKPEPKPDVVRELFVTEDEVYFHLQRKNLTLTFDGETGKLKSAEVL